MREQLWRYYPQFLEAVDGDVATPWALDLWRRLPTPQAGQRARPVTFLRVLKQHRIRRIDGRDGAGEAAGAGREADAGLGRSRRRARAVGG